ncbi:Autotransporter adhesin, partial [Methylobacillus rhizosphaerae]
NNGGPIINSAGINVNNTKITNVAAGTDATDAVNVSQLNDAAAAATTKVAAGTNVNDVAESTNADGSKTYTVNANGTTASAGSTAVTVTAGAKDANNVTDYQVDLAQQTKDDIAQGVEANDTVNNKGLTFTGDSGTTGTKKLGDTVAVNGDDNITTTADADGVKVALNKDLSLTSVTTGNTTINNDGLTIVGGPSVTIGGINAGGTTITNVAAGVNPTDAVNVSQLTAVSTIANMGWNVSAQGANQSNVAPGANVDLGNTDGNIVVSKAADSNDVKFNLADDLAVNNSITVNGGTTITGDTVTTTNVNTTNLKAGDNFYVDNSGAHYNGPITEGDHIVNKNYVDESVNNATSKPLTFAGDTGENIERKLGETVNVKGGATGTLTEGNIGVESNGSDTLTVKLAENVDLGSNGSVTTGNTTVNNSGLSIEGGPSITQSGIDAGGTRITNVAAGVAPTDAVNVSQLEAVAAESGSWNLSSNGGAPVQVSKNATVNVSSGSSGNVTVTQDGTNLTIDTNPDMTANSLTINGGATGSPVVLNNNGLNNGGNTITNVAPGVNGTDAVNVDQLNGGLGYVMHQQHQLRRDAFSGIAGAIAQSSIPQVYQPGKSMVGAGVGYYGGESALAIGASTISDNGSWVLKANASVNTRSNVGVGAGVGFQW